ncbi:MAG TPA: efflux RND transporter periplasmic adaptor subunit [Bryobacteraceae bacterium]|jgi:RND family efflux transporter MFP subunit|nr:efflux RND transporter periplasmic adaptor subunit [Bryobacteraceae bacterium]
MKKNRAWPLVALIALSAVGCSRREESARAAPAANPETPVPAVRVTRADLSGSITLTGEFIPYQEVDVMAKVAGYIRSINVDIGDRVRAGQVLAVLEVPEMENEMSRAAAAIDQSNAEAARAEDDVRRSESAHDIAHLSLGRIDSVSKKEPGLVPQQQVDEAHSRDLEAEAQVAAAKSNLAAARESVRVLRADEARLKTMQNYETITAPFDGIVTKRYANQGAMIQAGTASQSQAMPVVRVSQNTLLRLMLPVPESAVPEVAVGHAVRVQVPSLNRTFDGHVTRFTDSVQLSTRTMDTEVDVPNPSLTLVPGMYAEVKLELQEHRNTLAAPPDAIEGAGANASLYQITPAGTIHIVPVQLGLEMAQQVEIVHGATDGELVVAGRRGSLKEGDRVKPVPAAFLNSR